MKIRIFVPFSPWPPREGGFVVIDQQVRALLREGHQVEVVITLTENLELTRGFLKKHGLEAELRSSQFLIRTLGGKDRTSESAIERLKRVVTSVFLKWASPELYYYPVEMGRQLEALEPWDLEIFHYSFACVWGEQIKARKSRKAVYLHNLESELFDERAKEESWVRGWIQRKNFEKLRQHEKDLASLFDELWFVSPRDLKTWQKSFSALAGEEPSLRFVPPVFDFEIRKNRERQFVEFLKMKTVLDLKSPKGPCLGILGGLEHKPNQQSVEWVLKNVAPLLREAKFTGRIFVVGRRAPEFLVEMAKDFEFVEFRGFVEDLEEFWKSLSIMLVPHIGGSGVRIKLLEAVVSGVPVMATHNALECLGESFAQDPHLFFSDDPSEWSRLILDQSPFDWRTRLIEKKPPSDLNPSSVFRFLGDPK